MTSVRVPLVFDYAGTPATAPARLRSWALLRFAISLAALAIPFMPFACDTSPLSAVTESFDPGTGFDTEAVGLLGFGFFVAFPLLAWRAMLLWRPPGRRLRRVAIVTVLLTWIPYTWLHVLWVRNAGSAFADGATWREFATEQYPWVIGLSAALACVLLAWRLWTTGDRNAALHTALLSAWLGTAVFCIVGFYGDDLDAGGYLTLAVALFWSAEAAADATRLGLRCYRSREIQ